MSLKRREIIAWVLLLLAALCLGVGKSLIADAVFGSARYPIETSTYPDYGEMSSAVFYEETTTVAPSTVLSTSVLLPSVLLPTDTGQIQPAGEYDLRFAWFLCAAGGVMGIIAVFVLRQKRAILGPDGVAFLLCLCSLRGWYWLAPTYNAWAVVTLMSGLMLLCLREIWGWLFSRLDVRWTAVSRIAASCPGPQLAMLSYVACPVCTFLFSIWVLWDYFYKNDILFSLGAARACVLCLAVLAVFQIWSLLRYGADLRHFQKQLENFRTGAEIEAGDGSFRQDEALLQQIQAEHAQAVKTAVASERFKVDLIANVSHDLRTPLTSILGYGELLQRETLSETGALQLERLNQKAGYMNDLVESLFELTKVSSGVAGAKQEQIDLLRLIEQTIGLFDDRLTAANLEVRRHYAVEAAPAVTDGARMHQVFANLLGNAIKYALPGTRIHIHVTWEAGIYKIRMVNTASYEMDFAPEEMLERFARGDKARSTKGSGLGLAIARTYTESVGGSFHIAVDGDQFSATVNLPKTDRDL